MVRVVGNCCHGKNASNTLVSNFSVQVSHSTKQISNFDLQLVIRIVQGRGILLKTRLILQKDGKTIFSLKCKKPKKSAYGELDIMIDAGKNLFFDQVVAGNFFRHYHLPKDKINAVSWHGYYESKNEGQLFTPIIHFKNGYQKVAKEWHLGSINHEEPFAFPICSVFLPQEMNLSNVNTNQYTEQENIKYFIKDIDNNSNKRIDIFVTSKGLTAEKIINSSIGWVYKFADIDMFNTKEGLTTILNREDTNRELETIEDDSGHNMIIRIVRNDLESSIFSRLNGSFSLLVHDPNDAYQRIVNRPIIEIEQGANVLSKQGLQRKMELLKEKYEKEVRKD